MKIYEVATSNNERLDRYLERMMVDVSRSQIRNYILEGLITVNGETVKAGYKIKNKDRIAVALPETVDNTPIPKPIPLDIVHEDRDLLVVNKPKGLLVHPTDSERENTLVSALLYLSIPLAQSGEAYRPGIVHRLDKDTAGLMVVAKTHEAYQALSTLIQNRQIERHYLALVEGVMGETSGRIDQPIGRNPKSRYLRKVVPEGRRAVTHYEVLEHYPRYTLVGCQLETGRTHQIRVHLAYLGHPVVGDPLYNQKGTFYKQKGQLLVADRLSFTHPLTGDVLAFEIDLPDYFKEALKIAKNL